MPRTNRRAFTAAQPGAVLPFVQLEFTHSIGIPPGGYTVTPGPGHPRAAEGGRAPLGVGDADSLLVELVAARAAARRRFGSAPGSPWPAAEVAIVLATLVLSSEPLPDSGAAARQLSRWRADPALQRSLLDRTLSAVNRGIRAYRAAALDPYVVEVMEVDPRVVRLGYGSAGVGARTWLDAFSMEVGTPTVKARSEEQLRIGETVGAALAGADLIFEAEELALRALLDLRHHRVRAAAAQARAAVEVLKDELRASVPDPRLQSVIAVETVEPELIEATAMHVLETASAYRTARLRTTHSIASPA